MAKGAKKEYYKVVDISVPGGKATHIFPVG